MKTPLMVVTVSASAALLVAQPCEPAWSGAPGVSGIDGSINALAAFDDGSGMALYAAGTFVTIDGVAAPHVARWDGHHWEAVGSGLGVDVLTLAVFDAGDGPRLYAGGMYYLAGQSTIAVWDGQTWQPVPGTPNAWVGSLGVSSIGGKPELYASLPVFDYMRRWDGSNWRSVGSGLFGIVWDFEEYDDGTGDALYAGGDIAALYRFDGVDWSVVGNDFGFDSTIRGLETFDDGHGEALFVGGWFTRVPGFLPALRVARWDGAGWSQVGDGFDDRVNSLAVFDDGSGPALYAAGAFTHSGPAPISRVARWDGVRWSGLGPGASPGLDGPAFALAPLWMPGEGGALVAAGEFTNAGGQPAAHLASWMGCGCAADVNGDGAVTTQDVLLFLNRWVAQESSADWDGNGFVDTRDFLAFLNAWVAGC
ncbi:MAG: hypothetical protein IPJ41_00245 [Phycisphaerales bacterium]|nr:hypothetical protein [Phycisphaerales bacterium]